MKQALTALIRDTFARKGAEAALAAPKSEQDTFSTIRTLDLAELRQVSGGDAEIDLSPKRGW